MRARRWTREIALAAVLTVLALAFLGSTYWRGAVGTASTLIGTPKK